MRFNHTSRRYKYVIVPRVKTIVNGTTLATTPGLSARFLNHLCDTEREQRNKGWTNEERKTVEAFLLAHEDYMRPGGFYLENAADDQAPIPPMEAVRCIAFFRNETNEVEQCPSKPLDGSEFCAEHEPARHDDRREEAEPASEPVYVSDDIDVRALSGSLY